MKKKPQKPPKPVLIYQHGKAQKLPEVQVLALLENLIETNTLVALQTISKVQADNPHAERIRGRYYQLLCDLELKQELLESTETKLSKQPRDKLALSYLAHGLRLSGKVEEAAKVLEKLLKLAPSDTVTINSLASAVKELGDFERADNLLDRAIKISPSYGKAFWNRSDISQNPEQDLEKIKQLLASKKIPETEQHYLHFSAYRLLEKNKKLDQAFEHLRKGNQLKRKTLNYKIEDDLRIDAGICSLFTADFIESKQTETASQAAPFFIFGMPRSGTTLVEQIIASHSQVQGGNELSALGDATRQVQRQYRLAGEFPDWLKKLPDSGWQEIGTNYLTLTNPLKNGKTYLTDKALLNYKTAGLIKICLPNAKLIQVDRNPMDLCFGCYRQLFNEGLKFSYDFEDLARMYASYQNLMDHWNKVLPGFVLRVKYEELVKSPQEQIQSILDFCGLTPEPACFEPHKTERTVRTLSATQVREPIFARGINRWKAYEEQLQPLRAALAKQGITTT